jgi:hypothetical protein
MTGADASGWAIAGDVVIWARSFRARLEVEQRDYVGMAGVAVTGVEPGLAPAALTRLKLPEAGPFTAGDAPSTAKLAPLDLAPVKLDPDDADALVRLASAGGTVGVARPADATLADSVGRILSWLPADLAGREGGGYLVARGRAPAVEPAGALQHYLARAIAGEPGFARRAWRLVLDLCGPRGDAEETFRRIAATAETWDTAESLRRHLAEAGVAAPVALFAGARDAGWAWNRVLNSWGRGHLGDAGERLADVLARRVVADHLVRLDHPETPAAATRHLGRMLFEALLTHDRRRELTTALGQRLPSLVERA